MKLALSYKIPEIDAFAAEKLGLSHRELMRRSGEAVAKAVIERAPKGKKIILLAGKGNNGGDGYAAALGLAKEYEIKIYDMFSAGQKSEEGKYFLEEVKQAGIEVIPYSDFEPLCRDIDECGCIVDAIFGTGFLGDMPEFLRPIAVFIREKVAIQKVAIDVPLGVNPDDGSISEFVINATATVCLGFIKPGIISYPARSYVGDIVYSDIGLPMDKIEEAFSFNYSMIDGGWVSKNLPKRESNSHKGSFGKLLLITGSERYRGAAHLSAEAALRGGVSLVSFVGCDALVSELAGKYPEIIYHRKNIATATDGDISEIVELSKKHTATLIGSGSDNTAGLLSLTLALLEAEGGPLVLDADALNALSTIGADGIRALKNAKREVIITPHPLEFARISMTAVDSVQLHRMAAALKFSAENKLTLVLKGAGTIITDGNKTFINTTGSSALAKAGSGDVLAGLIGAIVAQAPGEPLNSSAASVYLHAVAGQTLAGEFSSYGVTPSDLPKEIARTVSMLENS